MITGPRFTGDVSGPISSIATIFDFQGFTDFITHLNQVQRVPQVLQFAFAIVAEQFGLGDVEQILSTKEFRFPLLDRDPIHVKFLGDGLLIIWTAEDSKQLSRMFAELLTVASMIKREFPARMAALEGGTGWSHRIDHIRFGIAAGDVYQLSYGGDVRENEFVGVPINLAARLQAYCRELGLVASLSSPSEADIVNEEDIAEEGFMFARAKALKGFKSPEPVIVEHRAYWGLDPEVRERLFVEYQAID